MHRDPRKSAEYFASFADFYDRSQAQFRALLASEERVDLLHVIFRQELHLLIAAYGAGADKDDLRARYTRVIDALGAYQRVHGFDAHKFSNFDAYIHGVWLLSLAILLDVDDAGLKNAIIQIRNGAQDAIFDRLLALRMPDRAKTAKALYPRPYKGLLEALDATPDLQPKYTAKFLKGYLTGMTPTYWYGSHEGDDKGYFGYWCFELAAFVKLGALDPATFADNELYPRDLV